LSFSCVEGMICFFLPMYSSQWVYFVAQWGLFSVPVVYRKPIYEIHIKYTRPTNKTTGQKQSGTNRTTRTYVERELRMTWIYCDVGRMRFS
jgi:hypothetical protein